MVEGRKIHEEIADYIQTYNSFPDYLIDKELKLPMTEKEIVVRYNDVFDFKCIIDCLDTPFMYEFKTGVSDSLEWARTKQIPLYLMALDMAKIKVESAYLIHYNQHTKESDYTIIHNNKTIRDEGRNVLDSVGPEILEFFTKEGLI
jgi:hypothetical protein